MPASIQDAGEVKLFNAAPFSSPSPSSSTISCESIKTIEAWLNEVEEPEVTVIVKELGKAGSDLAQEPEVGSSRKRKHSSSLTEADLSQSSLRKRSKHLLQLVTDYGMAGNTLGGGQVCLHNSIAIQAFLTKYSFHLPPKVPPRIRHRRPLPSRQDPRLLWILVGLVAH